ncbi:Calx-beta domain-containing protein [Spongiimicrobium salis]|uniref:Calx-beta domain-containing protein n=1 Tax=Spongiimicrobium salis TaxID=1667022 RepID=UPI00374D4FFB
MSLFRKLFSITLFLSILGVHGQVQKTFTPRYSETINGDVTMIANNVLSRTSTGNFNGSSDNQENFSVFVDIDSDNSTFNSSNATLVKPLGVPNSCIGIRKVLLYWAASDKEYDPSENTGDGGTVEPNSRFDQVKLMLPGETSYNTVTADEVIYRGRDFHFFNDPYICVKDITSDVSDLTDPYGTYQIANLKATEGTLVPHGGGNFGAAGGWQIVFVYEFQSLTRKNITLFDGYAHVRNNASVDVLFDGFTTVPSGPVNADIVLGSIEGDRVLNGDTFQILKSDNTFESISTSQRDANNFFNSKITLNGSDFLNRNPASTNTLGYDASIFQLSNTSNRLIDNNQTSATFRATSGSESYGLYLMGFSVEVFEPSLGNLDFTTTSSSTSFNPGGDVQLSLGIENSGNDNIRNLVISTIIPAEVDFLNTEPLPTGVTSSYNASTRELLFTIADGLTDVGDAPFNLDFNVSVKEQCYFLESVCAGNFEIQAIANFTGEINTAPQTTNSSGTTDACSNGNHDPTVIGINRPDQVNFATAVNALDRTISCSDTAALNAAQALVPTTEFCNFTLNKVSGNFVPNPGCDVEGTYTNTWTFTDACGRTSETFTQVITIEDTTAPVFDGTLPADIPAAANNIPTADILTASDTCDSNPLVVLNETFVGDNTSDTYTIIRTWTASDCAGNETIHVQRVFVTENGDPLGLTINDIGVNEGDGTATFAVRLTGEFGAFSVDYATANATASAPNDFNEITTSSLSFNGNHGEIQNISVTIVDDLLVEATETFTVELSNLTPNVTVINKATGTGTINDNDNASIRIADVTVDEATGSFNLEVTLNGNVQEAFTIDFSTADATALAGNDYVAATGQVSFPANSTDGDTQPIVLNVNDDDLIEETETYLLDLNNLVSEGVVTIADNQGIVTITDNDAVAGTGLDFDNTDVTVDEAAGTATFTVRLTGNVPGGFTVDFATADGSAIAGEDYSANSGTLTFLGNNDETQNIVIDITDDALIENTEGYVVDLSGLSTALIGINTPQANGNITDNDAVAGTGLDFDNTDVTVDEATGTATFTVRLTGNVPGGFTVDFATADGSAIAGEDYSANSGTLTFLGNNDETQDIVIDITDDALIENTEGYVVDLSGLSTALIGINTPQANGNITDNDAVAGTGLDFDNTNVTVDEATGTATFTVRLTGNVPGGFTVDFATADGSAIAGEDYSANSGTLTFLGNNDETQNIVIDITDDALIENTEGYVVDLSGLSTSLIGINTPQANGNITDNDAVAGTGLDFDNTNVTVDEAAGTATFTVRLTGNVPGGFTVDFATADGSAIAGEDYSANSGTLTFLGNNNETQDIVIDITDDALIENTEGYVVDLSGLSTALIGINTPQANGNITDNDAVAGTGLDFDSTDVTVDEAAGTATFTVRLTGNVPGGFTMDFATADGSAIAGEDYSANSGTLTFLGNNDETQDIVIDITDDNLIETTEGYVVDLSGLSTSLIGINTPQANGNITDNDAVAGTGLDFDNTNVTVDEAAGTATFTVRLTGNVPGGFTMDFATGDGSAIAGEDYSANSGTLTFLGNNDETQDIVIDITDDALIENTEGYVVDLSGLSTALIGINTPQANGNITDNDAVAGTGLDFDNTDVTVDEATGTATFTVRLTGNVPGGFTVDFATADGTAIAGEDYSANSGTLTFLGNNDETQDIVIDITDDALIENTEGYVVNLSGLSTALIGINTPQANGNITDNDAVAGTGLDFDNTNVTVDEATGTATFTVRLTGNVPGGFTMDFATADGSAIAGEDYSANSGTLTFLGNNDETQDIVIDITDDALIETTEGYVVDLSGLSTSLIGINTPQANGNITDNDAVAGTGLDFDNTDVTVDEAAGTATFTVRLTGNVPGGFTVDFATADGSAIAGEDYSANSGTLTFLGNNDETQDIVIDITDDNLIETTEGYVVDLSGLSTSLIGINTPQANGNITDNDAVAGTGLDFDNTNVTVDEAAGTATFTVRLTGNVPGGFTMDFATGDGSAIAGEDYSANSGTLTFLGNNDETQDITVSITDDALIENTEGYVVDLSGLSTALIGINTPQANGNIIDNDSTDGYPMDLTVDSCDDIPATDTIVIDRACDVTLTHHDDIISGDTDACPSEYTITRTWTVTNCNGFTTEHIQTITVLDRDKPEFVGSLPTDTTASCDTIPVAEVLTATDNCSGIATVDFNEEIINQDASCPNNYQIIRTWTATDCAGNTAVHTQTIQVEDTTAPTFVETLPQNMTVSCDSIPDAEVLTAVDNCDTHVDVSFIETITNDANCAEGYTITRVWRAMDCSGNPVNHTQILTIDPTGPISVNDYEEEITITCGDAIPEVPELVFTGGCGDYQVVFNEVEEFSDTSDDYMIIRSWDVTDACGNTGHFEQIVFVLQPKLEEISISLCVEDNAIDLTSYLPSSFDANGTFTIDGSNIDLPQGNFDPSLFELGTYTILYSATQASCNYLAEFTIEVHADCVPCGVDQLEFSKTITANGDGKNDFFEIKGAEFCDYIFEVQIFNRWGNIVYRSDDYQNDWDAVAPNSSFGSSGTVPSGTYYYIVNIKNSDIKTINGFLYIGAN